MALDCHASRSQLGIARILTRQGQFDEALAVLNRAILDQLQGTRRERFLKARAEVGEAKKGKAES